MADDKGAPESSRILLRLPPSLKERLAQRAAAKGRSMNSEIVEMIESALFRPGTKDVMALIAEAGAVVEEMDRAAKSYDLQREQLEVVKNELRSIFGADLGDEDPILHAVGALAQGNFDFTIHDPNEDPNATGALKGMRR